MILAAQTAALLLCEAAADKGAAPLVVLQIEEALHLRGGDGCGEQRRAVGVLGTKIGDQQQLAAMLPAASASSYAGRLRATLAARPKMRPLWQVFPKR